MTKINLLLNDLDRVIKINIVKFVITEVIILLLSVGSFYTNLSYSYQLIIFMFFLAIFCIFIVIYYYKLRFISNIKTYLNNPTLLEKVINKRKNLHLDILDYLNEKLIINEITRTINNFENYSETVKIGPWDIVYNYQKTYDFNNNYKIQDKSIVNKITKIVVKLNNEKELIEILRNIGIDYKKVYSIWGNELMYPIFGMLINDSQVLIHGLRNKEYKFNEKFVIKPYERKLEEEDIIMLHIKVKE